MVNNGLTADERISFIKEKAGYDAASLIPQIENRFQRLTLVNKDMTERRLKDSERWTAGAGVNYRPLKFLKLDAGYKYIRRHSETETTKKGNIIPAYWYDRHRAYISATGKMKIGRFGLSLRERYQFTHRVGKWVPKFASDGVKPKDDEWISSKNKHILRSRLECEYEIKKSRFKPFGSVEFYDNLGEGFTHPFSVFHVKIKNSAVIIKSIIVILTINPLRALCSSALDFQRHT